MVTAVSRRQFLRGDRLGGRVAIRPPWSLPEAAFLDACTRCGDCIAACRVRLIVPRSGGFPEVDFSGAECSFCSECARVCRSGALRYESHVRPWTLRAVLGEDCIATQGVVCGSCADACNEAAIRLAPAPGGVAQPHLAAERCKGCGACVAVCPTRAINMRSNAAASTLA